MWENLKVELQILFETSMILSKWHKCPNKLYIIDDEKGEVLQIQFNFIIIDWFYISSHQPVKLFLCETSRFVFMN